MKKIWLLGLLVLLAVSCRVKPDNETKARQVVQQIENSINQVDFQLFSSISEKHTFYDFFTMVTAMVKAVDREEKPMTLTVKEVKGSNKKVKVKVGMRVVVDLNMAELEVTEQISESMIQQILSIGMPDEVTFTMEKMGEKYQLTKVSYPMRYFYMNLLANN